MAAANTVSVVSATAANVASKVNTVVQAEGVGVVAWIKRHWYFPVGLLVVLVAVAFALKNGVVNLPH
jgi:hypothetical protein